MRFRQDYLRCPGSTGRGISHRGTERSDGKERKWRNEQNRIAEDETGKRKEAGAKQGGLEDEGT
jgi:hypothetical protein